MWVRRLIVTIPGVEAVAAVRQLGRDVPLNAAATDGGLRIELAPGPDTSPAVAFRITQES